MLLEMLFPNPGCWRRFYLLLLRGAIASLCTTAPVPSAELFSVQAAPQPLKVHEFIPPHLQNFAFPLVEFLFHQHIC